MFALKKPPFTIAQLKADLEDLYTRFPDASPWAPLYAAELSKKYPELPVEEAETRLRATARQHHMYQDSHLGGVRNPDWATWYATDLVTRWEKGQPLYPHVPVQLTGRNGNAMVIMGAVSGALRKEKVADTEIDRYLEISRSGDYDNVLSTAMEWVDVR